MKAIGSPLLRSYRRMIVQLTSSEIVTLRPSAAGFAGTKLEPARTQATAKLSTEPAWMLAA